MNINHRNNLWHTILFKTLVYMTAHVRKLTSVIVLFSSQLNVNTIQNEMLIWISVKQVQTGLVSSTDYFKINIGKTYAWNFWTPFPTEGLEILQVQNVEKCITALAANGSPNGILILQTSRKWSSVANIHFCQTQIHTWH